MKNKSALVLPMHSNIVDEKVSKAFEKLMNFSKFVECDEYKEDKFCVSRNVKRRYINPLTREGRIYDISKTTKEYIDEYLNTKKTKYVYIEKLY